jgi:general secretion pathway protein G
LIELLLVLVILGILAAVVVPKLVGRAEQAKHTAAITDVANLKNALGNFEVDNGRFPTTEEGLQALVTRPSADLPNWHGYIEKLPQDPWIHPYIYRAPGSNGKSYDLISGGPDGHEGGDDDITN